MDLTALEFCNSSGFKSFIHWIERIQQAPEPKRYKLRFLSTKERKWQRASLLALSCYGINIVLIDGAAAWRRRRLLALRPGVQRELRLRGEVQALLRAPRGARPPRRTAPSAPGAW